MIFRSTHLYGWVFTLLFFGAAPAVVHAQQPSPEQSEEGDSEPETDEDSDTDGDSETDQEDGDDPDAEEDPDAEDDLDAEDESDAEDAPDAEDESDAEDAPDAEDESDTEDDSDAGDDAETEPQLEPESGFETAPDAEPDTGGESAGEQEGDQEADWPDEWDDDFDDEGADPLPIGDLDDEMFDQFIPMARFPHVDWDGQLRVRPRLRYNYDLDTGGTSAVLPPVETRRPTGNPADSERESLWTSDLRFRVAPSFHLTEALRVHTDLDFLRNVAFGSDPRHSYFLDGTPTADRSVVDSSAGQPGPVHVREAYGEFHTVFGTIAAGRMLDHWGLGIFANDGNCTDCNWGDQVDRLSFETGLWDFSARATWDFPNGGLVPQQSGFDHGVPHRLGGLGSAGQWTATIHNAPRSREDREQQSQTLDNRDPVYNGGLYFISRSQDGAFTAMQQDTENLDEPIYRGLSLYHAAPWFQFLWEPEQDESLRVELEGLATFGSVDNATDRPVGFEPDTGAESDVNCFDEESREGAPSECRTDADGIDTHEDIRQFGLALETEYDIEGPVSFGLNGGFATGGDSPNWGYGAAPRDQLDFTRFSPDYHVDLILFREVIGSVTNAYYANPYARARFFDTGLKHIELQLDGIASRAFDPAGTPGDSSWLGVEFDTSLRYVVRDAFVAAIDGGLLFPLGGLAARDGRARFNTYGDPGPFVEDSDPSLAWTIQGRLSWDF